MNLMVAPTGIVAHEIASRYWSPVITMFRAFFLALGLSTFLLGLECLVIDRAVIKARSDSAVEKVAVSFREVRPPEWAPWSLLSGGAVVMLYSFTVPAKLRG